jgi:hypothetical protein
MDDSRLSAEAGKNTATPRSFSGLANVSERTMTVILIAALILGIASLVEAILTA